MQCPRRHYSGLRAAVRRAMLGRPALRSASSTGCAASSLHRSALPERPQPMICSETWRYIHRPALHLVLEVSPDAPRAPSTGRRMFGRSGLTLRCATGPEWRCCLSRRCAPPPSPSLRAARAPPAPCLSPPRSAGALARTVCRSCCVCGLISGGHPLQAHPRLPSFAMQANHAR